MDGKIGKYVFLVGAIVAVLTGLIGEAFSFDVTTVGIVLVIAGIIVGLLNVSGKEATTFLISAITLLVIGGEVKNSIKELPWVGTYLEAMLIYLVIFVAPAAIVVALKEVYSLAQD